MFVMLAWRNLWRNRSRTLITMASVWCAVLLSALTQSLQRGAFELMVANVVSFYTGYLQVQQSGYWDEQTLEYTLPYTDTLRATILQHPGVAALAPRIQVFALASTGEKTKGCLVAGIEPEAEDRVTRLRRKITAGQYLTDSMPAVLAADGLARRLHIGVGDTLVLLGQGYYGAMAAGKFPVCGILHFGSPDLSQRAVFMSLSTAQQWLDAPGQITTLVLSPENPASTDKLAAGLKASLPPDMTVKTWMEMMPDLIEHIKTDTASSAIFLGVLYVLITFGIFATLLMMLLERRREFGMLLALGMKKGQLARVVLYESVLITFSGCLLGILTGIPVIWWFARYPIRIGGDSAEAFRKFGFEPVIPASTDPGILLNQALAVLFIGLVLSWYPAYKIFTMNPVEAMRG